jgi:hypothetical protein
VLVGLIGAWLLANRRRLDLLAQIDPAHAEGHTHHLSTAARLMGDIGIALGPKPARKWAGLGPFGSALSLVLAGQRQRDWATAVSFIAAAGNILGLVGFRRPERALSVTAKESLPSFGIGAALGLLMLLTLNPQPKTDDE